MLPSKKSQKIFRILLTVSLLIIILSVLDVARILFDRPAPLPLSDSKNLIYIILASIYSYIITIRYINMICRELPKESAGADVNGEPGGGQRVG